MNKFFLTFSLAKNNYRNVLLLLLLMLNIAKADSKECLQFFIKLSSVQSPLASKISKYRKSRVYKDETKSIVINSKKYFVKGVLGEGTSTVYLAAAPNGQMVTIKLIEDYGSWINSLYYEIAVTEFYLQMGVKVPHVYDYEIKFNEDKDIQIAALVKEYREGVTREELEELIAINPRQWADGQRLLNELNRERKKLGKIHAKFSKWLKENNINLEAHPFKQLQKLIKEGDMDEYTDNFLYDTKLNQWILFDP